MLGMVELGEEIFHMPVRLGQPTYNGSLGDVVRTPRYSTVIGLVMAGMEVHLHHYQTKLKSSSTRQIFERMKSWFQENF